MAYTLTLYNTAFNFGSLQSWMFRATLVNMWLPYSFAIVCEMLLAKPIAQKVVAVILPPDSKPLLKIFAMSFIIVSIMCPVMTLLISVVFGGINAGLPAMWLGLFLRNYIFVLCFQIVIAGPLVRAFSGALFRTVAVLRK